MPNFTLRDSVFEEAAERFPTPFHLYDEGGIRDRARRLRKADNVLSRRCGLKIVNNKTFILEDLLCWKRQ